MRIYLYTLRHDGGFSPNPFHGYCTLACCKPQIRRKVKRGDWVVGITPRHLGNRLAYAMHVDEVRTFAEYWTDVRFRAKRPRWTSAAPIIERCGDNCYEPIADGTFRQLRSAHWDHSNDREDVAAKTTDHGGKHVLVAKRFAYFGSAAVELPDRFSSMMPARYTRVNFAPDEEADMLAFLEALPHGVHAAPRGWKSGDLSWQQKASRCG